MMKPEYFVLIGILLFALIAIGATIDFKFPQWGVRIFKKKKSCGDKVLRMYNFTRDKIELINKFEANIYRNQLSFAEGILKTIQNNSLSTDRATFDTAKLLIKIQLKENGFENLDAVAFSEYIGKQIDRFRTYFAENLKDNDYINTNEFNDAIASIFNHARSCTEYWYKKIDEIEKELQNELRKLTNE